jgi:hypothetical protein
MPTEIVLNIHTPLAIAGIVIGLIAIGLFVWLRKDQNMSNDLHEAELHHTHQGMKALMDDFNNYQVETDRKISELEKQLEINKNNTNKTIEQIHKGLPGKIRGVIGHIEFSQNNLR